MIRARAAGVLIILNGLTQPTWAELSEEIDRCREMTERPFGLNLTIVDHQAAVVRGRNGRLPWVHTSAGRHSRPA